MNITYLASRYLAARHLAAAYHDCTADTDAAHRHDEEADSFLLALMSVQPANAHEVAVICDLVATIWRDGPRTDSVEIDFVDYVRDGYLRW